MQNEVMVEQVENIVIALKDDILDVVDKNVQASLLMSIDVIDEATSAFEVQVQENQKTMKLYLKQYKQNQTEFFKMNGIRNGIFWAGQIATVLVLLLLVYFLFFRI